MVSRCDPPGHIHQALLSPSFFFSPSHFRLGRGGETAIVKGLLVKIKITLLDSASAPWTDSPGDVPGALPEVGGWSSTSLLPLAVLPGHSVLQFLRLSNGDNSNFYTTGRTGESLHVKCPDGACPGKLSIYSDRKSGRGRASGGKFIIHEEFG